MRTKLHFDVANATIPGTTAEFPITKLIRAQTRAKNTEWSGIGSLFSSTGPEVQDHAESIKIRRDTIDV